MDLKQIFDGISKSLEGSNTTKEWLSSQTGVIVIVYYDGYEVSNLFSQGLIQETFESFINNSIKKIEDKTGKMKSKPCVVALDLESKMLGLETIYI